VVRVPLVLYRVVISLVLVVGAGIFVRNVRTRVIAVSGGVGKSLSELHDAFDGADVMQVLSRAARLIPEDGCYVLVDGSRMSNAVNVIRFHLAPRKPIFAGRLDESLRKPAAIAPVTIVATGDRKAPRIYDTEGFFNGFEVPDFGREDDAIPCAVDRAGWRGDELEIEGWCQERDARPCEVRAVFVGPRMAAPLVTLRYPRPDVARALLYVGDCARAGYRTSVFWPPPASDSVKVTVVFGTRDGRFRRYPPVAVTVGRASPP
jgi:hypothetical protein